MTAASIKICIVLISEWFLWETITPLGFLSIPKIKAPTTVHIQLHEFLKQPSTTPNSEDILSFWTIPPLKYRVFTLQSLWKSCKIFLNEIPRFPDSHFYQYLPLEVVGGWLCFLLWFCCHFYPIHNSHHLHPAN